MRPRYEVRGTQDAEIVKEFEPKPDDHVVIKCREGVTEERSMQDIIALLIKSYEEKKK